jgi:valyl-tRNA synthetase
MAQTANAALVAEQRSGANAAAAKGAATDGELSFFPARYAKTYEQWHENIRDWCISRQLWWGHRIPVWSCRVERKVGEAGAWADPLDKTLFNEIREGKHPLLALSVINVSTGESVSDFAAEAKRASQSGAIYDVHVCSRANDSETMQYVHRFEKLCLARDPDVLDTWFSSALWPLSTMGWPNPSAFAGNQGLLEAFNPTSTLCTAREIITTTAPSLALGTEVRLERTDLPEGEWSVFGLIVEPHPDSPTALTFRWTDGTRTARAWLANPTH